MVEEISNEDEDSGKIIVNAAFTVHKALSPAQLEKVYEICMTHELRKSGLNVERQLNIPIVYDGITFEEGLRLDLLRENRIIIELKAGDIVNPVWKAKIISHLLLTGKRLGFLINFIVPLIKDGIRRFVNTKYYFTY